MNRLKNRKLIYIIVSAVVLVFSALPMIVSWNDAAITKYSFIPIAFAVCSVIYAVIAFIFKDQGNLFVYGKHRFYRMLSLMVSEENESYTETEDYKREFALSALIYCITIPAYITFALFANGFYAALLQALEWSMIRAVAIIGVVIVPPIFKQVKERKQKRIQYEADRKEQERRESMGKWK